MEREIEEEEEETPVASTSRVPNPIPEIIDLGSGSVRLKRGRPPKMKRELQVTLSPLTLSCTQKLAMQKNKELEEPSERTYSKRERDRGRSSSSKPQAKIKFNFMSSRHDSSTKSETHTSGDEKEKPPSRPSSVEEKDSPENSEHNSGSANGDEKNQLDVEESDDTAWTDDYGFYRPLRAAAAAAMEAVHGRKTQSQEELFRLRLRNKVLTKQPPPRGRNRRTIIRRNNSQLLARGVPTTAGTAACKSIFHQGVYYQEGDIVTILGEDEEEYYCQIKSIMRDHNFIACVNLRWLIPRAGYTGPLVPFDPANFEVCEGVLDQNFSLDCVEFVMHCPHDYYYEHPVTFLQPVKGTVYMRLGDPLVTVEKVPIIPTLPHSDEDDTDDTGMELSQQSNITTEIENDL